MRAALAGRRGASGRMSRCRLKATMREGARGEPACIFPLGATAPVTVGEVARWLAARGSVAIDPGQPCSAAARPALGGPVLGGPALGGPALGGPALGGPALGGPALGGLASVDSLCGRFPGVGMASSVRASDPAGTQLEWRGCRALARRPDGLCGADGKAPAKRRERNAPLGRRSGARPRAPQPLGLPSPRHFAHSPFAPGALRPRFTELSRGW
jgi:hypothetical protein